MLTGVASLSAAVVASSQDSGQSDRNCRLYRSCRTAQPLRQQEWAEVVVITGSPLSGDRDQRLTTGGGKKR